MKNNKQINHGDNKKQSVIESGKEDDLVAVQDSHNGDKVFGRDLPSLPSHKRAG
jgi:hypothetical protein